MNELINELRKLSAAFLNKTFETRLQDGTPIKYSGELAEGTKMFAIGTEGESALSDGTFELENGKIVEVKDGAVVQFFAKPEEPTEPVATEPTIQEMFEALKSGILSEVSAMMEQSKADTEAKFAAVQESITTKESVNEELKASVSNLLEEIKKVEMAAPSQPAEPVLPGEAVSSRERAIQMANFFMNK